MSKSIVVSLAHPEYLRWHQFKRTVDEDGTLAPSPGLAPWAWFGKVRNGVEWGQFAPKCCTKPISAGLREEVSAMI